MSMGLGSGPTHRLLSLLLTLVVSTPARGQKVTESLDTAARALLTAERLSRRGRYDAADTQYQRAIRTGPRLIKAYERYSLFLYTRGKHAQGATVLRLGIRLNRDAPTLEAYLGLHLYRLDRIPRSYKLLKQTTAVHRKRFEIHAALAQCAMLMEDYPTVVKATQRYLETRPRKLAGKDHAFKVLASLALLRAGRRRQAARQLRRVLAQKSTYVPAWLVRAELLLEGGRCAKSIAAFEQLRPWVSKRDLAPGIARGYLCLKRPRRAYETADRFLREVGVPKGSTPATTVDAIREAAAVRRALMVRGEAALRMGDHDRALVDLRMLRSRFPGASGVVLRLAEALFAKGRYVESINTLASEPGAAALVLTLRAAVRAKKRSAALKAAGGLSGEGASARHLCYAGVAHSSFGLFARAVPLFERALRANPGHLWARKELIRARCYLARRALRKGRVKAALAQLQTARRDGGGAEVEHNIALIQLERGEPTLALRHARAALAGSPGDVQINRVTARALSALDRHAQALVRYRKALSLAKPETEPYFSLRAELAVAMIEAGMVSKGVVALQDLSRGGPEPVRLLAQRNLTRARFALARRQVQRQPAAAFATLAEVVRSSDSLPETERRVIRGLSIIAMARCGRPAAVRRVIASHWSDIKLALVAPFEKAGRRFLLAYVSYHTPQRSSRRAAAAAFRALARSLPPPVDAELRELAGSAHALLAYQHYQKGRLVDAGRALQVASRLSHRVAYDRLHNIAVLDYYRGRAHDALERLKVLSARVPLAQCNIGVHYHETGQMYASFQQLSQCQHRGVNFPGLKATVELKRQLFQGRGGR